MSLSFLYRSHVEMCFQMAATTTNPEVREQWTKLGERWRQKAEADGHQVPLHKATANLGPTPVPDVAPVQQFDARLDGATCTSSAEITQQKCEAAPNLAPTLISEVVPLQEKAKPKPSHAGDLSDIWTKIASPINLAN